jgi:hypothetical protein
MNPIEIAVIVLMVGYAVYKQTRISEIRAAGRFKLAIIYAIVGVIVGGFALPHTATSVALLVLGVALSVVCGVARGRLTRVWVDHGRVVAQGTAITVSLFVGLIAAKFGIGTYAYLAGIHDTGGFGEVMVMIAVMVAVQAETVFRRAQSLPGAELDTSAERVAVTV